MSAGALYGLAAWALLAGAGATFLTRKGRLATAAAVAALALVPVGAGESLAMVLHGALAAPSFTLVQLAILRIAAPGRLGVLGFQAAAVLAGTALVFYPLALGLGPLDPYGIGYQPLPILLVLLPPGAWLAWRRCDTWLAILGFDLLAYAGGIFSNLWDALFDPVLALVAVVTLVISRPRPGRSTA